MRWWIEGEVGSKSLKEKIYFIFYILNDIIK
jgi:hypothetical protein